MSQRLLVTLCVSIRDERNLEYSAGVWLPSRATSLEPKIEIRRVRVKAISLF